MSPLETTELGAQERIAPSTGMAARIDRSDFRIPPKQLRELYARHRRALYRFFQIRRPAEAEDLLQCVFLEALRSRPQDAITDPLKYLFGVAYNVLHTHYRRSKRQRSRYTATDPQDLEAIPESGGTWVSNDGDRGVELMQEALEEITRLPRSWQMAFLRSRCDGWSYQQIADELQVTPHTVKKYIVKTMAHLRIRLRQRAP